MNRIQTLSPATLAEQQQVLRWWRQSPLAGRTGEVQSQPVPNERHIRWARTTTDATYPTYPAGTKVIACELGEYTFDDSAVADVAGTFTAYSPAEIRYAYFRFGWRPKGSIVRITLHDGKWFCLDEASEIYGETSQSIAAAGSGSFDVWYNGAVTSPLQTITVYFDKMATGTVSDNTKCLVRFFADEDHFSIVERQCS